MFFLKHAKITITHEFSTGDELDKCLPGSLLSSPPNIK